MWGSRNLASWQNDIQEHTFPEYITPDTDLKKLIHSNNTMVIIGCVDNSSTRKILHDKLKELQNVVYIDSGNSSVSVPEDPEHIDRYQLAKLKDSGWSGQVVAAVIKNGKEVLPFPGDVFPDLIAADDKLPTEEIGCGEVVVSSPQRLMTNLMAATTVCMYLHTLLTDGTLLHHRSFFDARKGFVTSHSALDNLLEVSV